MTKSPLPDSLTSRYVHADVYARNSDNFTSQARVAPVYAETHHRTPSTEQEDSWFDLGLGMHIRVLLVRLFMAVKSNSHVQFLWSP